MKFTSILSAIVTFIRFIPDIYKVIKEVLSLIQSFQDKMEAKEKAQKVAEAIKTAKETKNTGDLEDMFGNSFDIRFIEEKKSLETGLLGFAVRIDDKDRLAEEIRKLQEEIEVIPPLKKIEEFVNGAGDILPETEENQTAAAPKKGFGFFSFGRSGSVSIGASFVNNVNMSGGARMGSKFLVFAMLFLVVGCKTGAKNEPSYKPALYAGDSNNGGVTRKQTGEFIRATDPKFDDMVSMRYSTLACIHKTYIANCREYKEQTVTCDGENVSFIKDLIKSR